MLVRQGAGAGVTAMIAGTLMLTTQDAIAKWLAEVYSPGEIMFYRGVCAFLPLVLLVRQAGGLAAIRSHRPAVNALRGLLNLLSGLAAIAAFAVMPLADALAVMFASPLFVVALSAWLAGERPGPWGWAGVTVGFAGVLLITHPGSHTLGPLVAVPLLTALLLAVRDVVTRTLGASETSISVLFYTVTLSVLGSACFLPFGTGFPRAEHWPLFAAAGVLNGFGQYLIIRAFALSEAGTMAPLRYLSLIWAMIIGALALGDWPDAWSLAGAILVVLGGLCAMPGVRTAWLIRREGSTMAR